MIVTKLELKSFRNYSSLVAEFDKKLNVITGVNGAGKTNIVEAIHYLSLARSFRAETDSELMKRGDTRASIEAVITEGDIVRKVKVLFTPEGKQITCNGKRVARLSELSGLVNVIIFEPSDVNMFRDVPKARRKFLDVALSKQSSTYLGLITRYEKALKERNSILKSEKPDLLHLDAITEILIGLAEPIIQNRGEYVAKINEILSKVVQALSGDETEAHLVYQPFFKPLTDFPTEARALFAEALEVDLRRKSSTVGIQREDFAVMLNGSDIGRYGSQGENRLIALALKLSPYFLIKNKEKRPIIVLDDALSELDQNHQARLITFLSRFEQVFITTTHYENSDASIYEVSEHKILRRKAT
jgi:DNA replication and repair protein RecF